MNIEELNELWGKDGAIDLTNVSRDAANIPYLHNKYYTMFIREKNKLIKYKANYKKLIRLKDDYYRGILDPDELKELGWKPCLVKVRPAEIQKYIESDNDVINASIEVGRQEELAKFLESIVGMINYRSQQLRLIVDMKKFENGGY